MPPPSGAGGTPEGAALRDICTVIGRRSPSTRILLKAVPVQGREAAPSIARAIRWFARNRVADVLIVGLPSAYSYGSSHNTLIAAVDINEVTTSERASLGIFQGAIDQKMFTPERVLAATRRVLQGVATRAVITTRTPDANVQAKLAAALEADVSGLAGTRAALRNVSFAS